MLPEARARVSNQEMQRRYAAVRDRMRAEGLEALLVSGVKFVACTGYLRYLTNWAEPFGGEYLLVPLEGEPLFFARTTEREFLVREILGIPAVVGSTAPSVVKALRERDVRRLGVCSLRTMFADFYVGLAEGLPSCELVDATALLDEVRMVKSDEELGWIHRSAELGDAAFKVFATLVQEGANEHDVFCDVDHVVKRAGAENTYFMMDADPHPVPKFIDMATKRYRESDLVLFNGEIQGPGGYYTQVVRTLSLGRPSDEAGRAFETLRAAFEAGEALLRPGTRTGELYRAMISTIENAGYTNRVHPGHSQGLDIFERPLIDGRDDVELQPNMIVVLHPHVPMHSGGGVWIGETFVITDSGVEKLHQSPRDLLVL